MYFVLVVVLCLEDACGHHKTVAGGPEGVSHPRRRWRGVPGDPPATVMPSTMNLFQESCSYILNNTTLW